MATIAFDKLNFAAGEEVIITGTVDDATATGILYGESQERIELSNGEFILSLGTPDAGKDYEFSVTIADGDSVGEIITETITIEAAEVTEVTEPSDGSVDEEDMGVKLSDPSPDYIPDYKQFQPTDTDTIEDELGSRTGFVPIDVTSEEKYPARRNIQTTHPVNGLFGSGDSTSLADEDSDADHLTTRNGGSGSPIATSGFTV
jgi:hypothetical protein